jgi:hypothetical protein
MLCSRNGKRKMRTKPEFIAERGGTVPHVKRYLCEFDFHYNSRKLEDIERTGEALKGIIGKCMTYRRTIRICCA